MEHQNYQERVLPVLKRGTNSPDNATIPDVVKGLLDVGENMEAVELIFATNGNNTFLFNDALGWAFFRSCIDVDNDLIIEISKNHQWSDNNFTKGFAIQVYKGEWLTILEPTATKALKGMR